MAITRFDFPPDTFFYLHENSQSFITAYASMAASIKEITPGSNGYNLTPATYAESDQTHHLVVHSPHNATYTVTDKHPTMQPVVEDYMLTFQAIYRKRQLTLPHDLTLVPIHTIAGEHGRRRLITAILYTEQSIV